MEPYVIPITVVALLVAVRVVGLVGRELRQTFSRTAPVTGPDFDTLGPDAGLWPGLFGQTAR